MAQVCTYKNKQMILKRYDKNIFIKSDLVGFFPLDLALALALNLVLLFGALFPLG